MPRQELRFPRRRPWQPRLPPAPRPRFPGRPQPLGLHTVTTIERELPRRHVCRGDRCVEATTYTDTGLTTGQTYLYRVKVRSFAGTSAYSNTQTVVMPSRQLCAGEWPPPVAARRPRCHCGLKWQCFDLVRPGYATRRRDPDDVQHSAVAGRQCRKRPTRGAFRRRGQ